MLRQKQLSKKKCCPQFKVKDWFTDKYNAKFLCLKWRLDTLITHHSPHRQDKPNWNSQIGWAIFANEICLLISWHSLRKIGGQWTHFINIWNVRKPTFPLSGRMRIDIKYILSPLKQLEITYIFSNVDG